MDFFNYQDGELYAEELSVKDLAQTYQTPLYVYSANALRTHINSFKTAFNGRKGLVCYAVKANSNLAILQYLASFGAGFDIVSGGELARVLAAGGSADKVIFSGVAKSVEEITLALNADIKCFNVESEMELIRINEVAGQLNKIAPVSLRINPNVDAKTHPYISTGLRENKFGIPMEETEEVYVLAKELPNIKIVGVDCHIGSQLTNISPYLEAIEQLKKVIRMLHSHNIKIEHVDIGGGLGVTYSMEAPPLPSELISAAYQSLEEIFAEVGELELIVEPGRSIVANAGILVTKVEYTKDNLGKNFAIIDAGMNDLIRPSLYNAYMNIVTVEQELACEEKLYDVVGPVCETGDFLGKNRYLRLQQDSLLAVHGAGAYGAAMTSNYNTRPKCAEVLVCGDQVVEIGKRQTYEDIWSRESLLSENHLTAFHNKDK